MPTNQDLTAKYEEERLRTHEQSQIVYLQGQVDELRRLIKDQTNKYNLVVEQVRRNEAIVNQVQGLFERHADETNRAIEASRRDIVALRTEIANALVKIDEGTRPLRDMQAQIHQLGDARKQDREYVLSWFRRIEELEQKLAGYQSQIKNIDDRERQLALQLDRLREADALAIQEARRVSEELQVEKQGLRRQAVEAQQLVADVHSILEDHNSRIQRLDEIRQHIDLFAETLPGQIVEISNRLPDFTTEIKRVERISTERFLMNQERLEELRHQADEKLDVLQETDEQHLRQLTAWLERTDSWLRELEQRVARSTSRYEEVQQAHIARINELERRELRMINALAVAFNSQAEVTQADQIAVRKDGDLPT
ncbi:MAG: hypothetical protein MUD01_11420 [Chloroflexaceae bacterium]|jgi:chromosome segregation ATPase|nr:hypothetical protein [Chloroflexaceae bacterium]